MVPLPVRSGCRFRPRSPAGEVNPASAANVGRRSMRCTGAEMRVLPRARPAASPSAAVNRSDRRTARALFPDGRPALRRIGRHNVASSHHPRSRSQRTVVRRSVRERDPAVVFVRQSVNREEACRACGRRCGRRENLSSASVFSHVVVAVSVSGPDGRFRRRLIAGRGRKRRVEQGEALRDARLRPQHVSGRETRRGAPSAKSDAIVDCPAPA